MSTTPAAPPGPVGGFRTLHLSELLRRAVTGKDGQSLGRLSDVIVRLRGAGFPVVTGLVVAVGGRHCTCRSSRWLSSMALSSGSPVPGLTCGSSRRREGEVLLRADVLGHRLLDVESAHLIRAADLELARATVSGSSPGWTPGGGPVACSAALPIKAALIPGMGQVRAADRPRRQCAVAVPVRPDPTAEARPDR